MTIPGESFEDALVAAIEALSSHHAPGRLRDLLVAEAALAGLPGTVVDVTSQVTSPDGGIDAITVFPLALDPPRVPSGRLVWQVKTGGKPSAASELGDKARTSHLAVKDEIARGADYVLVWTADVPSTMREEVERDFEAAASALRVDATARVVLARDLAAWAWKHPRVMATLISLAGALPLRDLVGTEVRNGSTGVEDSVRMFLDGQGVSSLRVHGPPGQGKSTALLLGAHLSTSGIAVLSLPAPEAASYALLSGFADRKTRVGLIVENCPADRLSGLEEYVRASNGSIRLITEGGDDGSGYPAAPSLRRQAIRVEPMMPNAQRNLLFQLGVTPQAAGDLIFTMGGNPMLVAAMATQPSTDGVLKRLTDGIDEWALTALALMPPVEIGEADIAAVEEAFRVPVALIADAREAILQRNLGPSQGRYRLAEVIAAFAVRRAMVPSRRQWLRQSLARVPLDGLPLCLTVLSSCGPLAHDLVSEVLDRYEAESGASHGEEPADIHALVDDMMLLASIAGAAPDEALSRLERAITAFPWSGPRDSLAQIAFDSAVWASTRASPVIASDSTAAARTLLVLAEASGSPLGIRVHLIRLIAQHEPEDAWQQALAVEAEQLGEVARRAVTIARSS